MLRPLSLVYGARVSLYVCAILCVLTTQILSAQTLIKSFPVVSDGEISMVFSPDGTQLAVAELSTIRIYDIATGRIELETALDHLISDITYTQGGETLAVGLWGEGARVLDVSDTRMQEIARHAGNWTHISSSDDGKGIFGGDWQTLQSVQHATGSQVETFEKGRYFPLWVFGQNGETEMTLVSDEIVFPTAEMMPRPLEGASETNRVTAALLYRREAIGDHVLAYFDTSFYTALNITNIGMGEEPRLKDFAETDRGPRMLLWRTIDDKQQVAAYNPLDGSFAFDLRFEPGTYRRFSGATISPDGNRIALHHQDGRIDIFASDDAPEDSLLLAEPETSPRFTMTQGHADQINDLAVSSDGAVFASVGGDARVHLWDTATGRQIRSVGKGARSKRASFSPDGKTLATIDSSDFVSFWDVETGDLKLKLPHNQVGWVSYLGQTGAFMVCGNLDCRFGTADAFIGDEEIRINLPRLLRLNQLWRMTASDDGLMVGTVLTERVLLWIDPTDGTTSLMSVDGPVTRIALENAALGIAATEDGGVLVIDPSETHVLARYDDVLTGIDRVTALGNGLFLLSQSGGTNLSEPDTPPTRVIFDTNTGSVVEKLPAIPDRDGAGNAGPVVHDKANNRVIAVSQSAWNGRPAIEIWPLERPEDVRVITSNALDMHSIAFSDDGKTLLLDGQENAVAWDLESGKMGSVRETGIGDRTVPLPRGWIYQGVARDSRDALFHYSPLSGETRIDWPKPEGWYSRLERKSFGNGHEIIFYSVQENTAFFARYDTAVMSDTQTGLIGTFQTRGNSFVETYLLSPDASTLIAYDYESMRAYSTTDGAELWHRPLDTTPDGVAFSRDGQKLFQYDKWPGNVLILETATGTEEADIKGAMLSLTSNGTADMLKVEDDNRIVLLDDIGLERPVSTGSAGINAQRAWLHAQTSQIVIESFDGRMLLWDSRDDAALHVLTAVPQGRHSVAFSPDGTTLAILETDGFVSLWRTDTGVRLARLAAFADGGWSVVAEDGRYDASDPGEMPLIGWVLPDAPTQVVPLELFYREFYEPSLLPRLINAEALPDLPPIEDLNRLQPDLRISAITPDRNDPRRVSVTIEAAEVQRGAQSSGLGDIKLFRDGQLVGLQSTNGAVGHTTVTFDDILLPAQEAARPETVFAAYAFNADGIKSKTVRRAHALPEEARPIRTAYVINIGVDLYDNPAWNLTYAAADAKLSAREMAARLTATGDYDRVVPISLLSTYGTGARTATQAQILAVLQVLGGEDVDPALLADIPGAEDLRRATPQDFVYLFYAGHGYAASDGVFHLFPQDIGRSDEARSVGPDLLSQTVTSDTLTALFLNIQAGDMLVVIDACNAAASVEGASFKPGPMGSRGLGQLAYDKGMRIMTASQAEGVALESDLLRHGALSYAMFREGLEGTLADIAPADRRVSLAELLSYGEARVPALYDEIVSDRFEPLQRGNMSALFTASGKPEEQTDAVRYQQRPSLFDFRRGLSETPIFLPL